MDERDATMTLCDKAKLRKAVPFSVDWAINMVNDRLIGTTFYPGRKPRVDDILAAEIERLRPAVNERDGLKAENAKLRYALTELIDKVRRERRGAYHLDGEDIREARAAVEGESP